MLLIVEIFSMILQRIFCDNTLDKKDIRWYYEVLVWGGYFVLFNIISYVVAIYFHIAWLNMFVFFVIFFGTVRLRYKNPNRTLLIVTAFMYLSGMCAELLTFYGKELLPWKYIDKNDIFYIVISKNIWFLLIKVTCQIVKISKKMELSLQDWLEVFIVPLGSILILLALFIAGTLENTVWGFLSVTMIMLINIFTYYLYDKVKENGEKRIREEILTQQCAYYVRQDRENKEWWEQFIHFRHDMKQRYIMERTLLESREYAALERYYDESLEFLNKKNSISDTGNLYIDSIINYKADIAQRENIDFVANINVPKDAELNAEDFCICIGNLLDNAIEAVMDVQDEKKIYVQLNADKNNLLINVRNKYQTARKKVKGIYLTNKPEERGHGLGILIIRQIVKKYNGEIMIQDKDGIFDVGILLYDFLKSKS